MTDDILIKLKDAWTNTEPHLKNITLLTENLSIVLRDMMQVDIMPRDSECWALKYMFKEEKDECND